MDLDIRRVPDVIFSADGPGKLLDHFPVVPSLKFVAVAPEVEQHRIPPVFGLHKPLCQFHQLRIVVMAGSLQAEPVLRQMEIMRGVHGPRVGDPAAFEDPDRLLVIGAVGIGKSPDHRPEDLLQFLPVPEHLFRRHVSRQADKGRVRIGMGGDLPAALCIGSLQPVQGHTPVDGPGGVRDIFRREAPAVDVERALQAVFLGDFDQLLILFDPVVVA